ncbi:MULTISPECIES: GlxA family transcriptional regulator [Pseudomonadaceae]|nr:MULTISPECIES: helix-turn-helix domain-containing protein [Pseudomonas]
MHTIWFLLLPGTHILDLGGPLQTMTSIAELELAPIEVRCISLEKEVTSFQGLTLSGLETLPQQLEPDDVLFVVGNKLSLSPAENLIFAKTAKWLSKITEISDGALICSICTGAFLLGEAGLLDDRQCTTHHRYVSLLQERYPKANVLDNRLFIEDGRIFSSAGVSSGTDLALHLVTRLFGQDTANRIARELVIYRRRAGEDSQLKTVDLTRNHLHPIVHAIQDYIDANLSSDFKFESLASQFNISYRHVARLFRENTGHTLHAYQRLQRMEHARNLLCTTNLNVEQIAEHCGYSSSHAFRLAWRQEMQDTPSQFRNAAGMTSS